MAENPHYRELLRVLNGAGVEFLVVGGYAVMKYTEPHFTKDLDIWVRNSPENAARVYRALAAFGAPLEADGVTPRTFSEENVWYQIGVAPVRVDITTHIDGIDFDVAWRNREQAALFGEPVPFLSLSDLIANKRAVGRSTDLEHLEQIGRAVEPDEQGPKQAS